MSITLDPNSFTSDGLYVEALSNQFLTANNEDILTFASNALCEQQPWALDTCIFALVWALDLKTTQVWKELRDAAWCKAVTRFTLSRCNVLFLGLT